MYSDDQSPMSWLSGLLTGGRQTGDSFDGNCSRNSIETVYHPESNFLGRDKDKPDRLDMMGEEICPDKLFDTKSKRLDTFLEEDSNLFTPHRESVYSDYNYYPYHHQHLPSLNKLNPFSLCQPVLESQFRFVSSLLYPSKLEKRTAPTPSLSSMSPTSTNTGGVYDPLMMPFLPQIHQHYYTNSNSPMDYTATNSNTTSVGSNNTDCGFGGLDRKLQISLQPHVKRKVGHSNLRPANAILLDEHFDNILFSDRHKMHKMHSLHNIEIPDTPVNSVVRYHKEESNNLQNSEGYNSPLFNTPSTSTGNSMDFLTYRVTRSGKRKGYTEFASEMNDIRTVSTASGDGSVSNSMCDSMSVSEASEDAYIKSGRGRRTRRLYDDKGTKISGVWYDASRHLWRVVYLKGDKRKTKGFSILKLGFEQARRQAIAFRQQMAPQK
ncbi:hypothetical protein BmR1_04g07020 [Babesia microti strain RI]|uniref:AP2/ERF domain-containing protein n=1 Tax=Babesia microti (strain RI) TaxID=1133968 RepID=I7I9T5_BABMR|nr:hypothetical protein BmR1_04g07020 [Babesia microti strain RI]CCF75599.1 hypothetical protein BmR1_04g07020 [Babesia microti strain RI]|eukprot:XP_012650007.1 hypothetical protein BmR1_04g07020 [Babesia microti strain RI]